MRHLTIVLTLAALFAGVFGITQAHDTDHFTAAQTTPTPEPSDPSNTNSATLFDLTTTPSEEVFAVTNGEVSDGIITLNAPADDEAFVDFGIPVQDYSIDMDVTFESYLEDTIFIFFLLRIQDDFCNFEFAYNPPLGEVYSNGRWLDDCDDWEQLGEAEGPVLNLNQTYNVRVVAEGNRFSLSIDGEEIISVEDDTLPDGYVGSIGIIGPAEATFDNLVVTDLTGAAAPSTGNTPTEGTTVFDLTTTPSEEVFAVTNGEVSDGIITLNAPADDEAFADLNIPVQDYSIDMDVTFESYSEDTIFIFFLLRVQDDFCAFAFVYDPAFGEMFSTVDLLDDCDEWEALDEAEGPVLNLDQTYNVRVVAEGNRFSLSIDGEEIISVEDDTLPDGYVGSIGIVGPAEATFDNLVVTDLTGAAATPDE